MDVRCSSFIYWFCMVLLLLSIAVVPVLVSVHGFVLRKLFLSPCFGATDRIVVKNWTLGCGSIFGSGMASLHLCQQERTTILPRHQDLRHGVSISELLQACSLT